MKIIDASYEILTPIDSEKILKNIEFVSRNCYKSENLITEDSAKKLVLNLIKHKHLAMIEHESLSIKFICDRGVSHEIVRHRICSFSQESQRYVNYSKDKFNNEITFIKPLFFEDYCCDNCKIEICSICNVDKKERMKYILWKNAMLEAEEYYFELIKMGAKPEEARSVLPNSTKTEIIMTANLREWRHFLELRTSKEAHPQMRELTIPLLNELKEKLPIIFDDIQ